MGGGFLKKVFEVIGESDLLIEVIDSRFPNETRNEFIEGKIREHGKELIIVLNKSDLISRRNALKIKNSLSREFPCVFISAKERKGINRLRELVFEFQKKKKKKIFVGVLGFPNTGKSSVINALKKRKSVKISITAGFTKGKQFISLNERILLIDSPGIIPFNEKDELKLALIGSVNPQKIQFPETVAEKIIESLLENKPRNLREKFGVETEGKNAEEILEGIAVKKKRLLKGGKPDTNSVARMLVLEWQKGRL